MCRWNPLVFKCRTRVRTVIKIYPPPLGDVWIKSSCVEKNTGGNRLSSTPVNQISDFFLYSQFGRNYNRYPVGLESKICNVMFLKIPKNIENMSEKF